MVLIDSIGVSEKGAVSLYEHDHWAPTVAAGASQQSDTRDVWQLRYRFGVRSRIIRPVRYG